MCGAAILAPGEAEERKLVSVVFCDLAGFTARSDRADPEDISAYLVPYREVVRSALRHHRGTLDRWLGDGVLAVFGAPVAGEDDARRAVAAAEEMVRGVDGLNAGRPAPEIAARAAVATGEVLVNLAALGAGPGAGDGLVGDVVNTASRLQAEAAVGTVVITDPTYRAVRNDFECVELPPMKVKGKRDPLVAWKVAGPVKHGHAVSPEGPMINRLRELDQLKRTWERALTQGETVLIAVVGEPGIGKSRLLRELRRDLGRIQPEPAWRTGRCLPYGEGVAYWALGEIVKAEAGIIEADSPEVVGTKLRKAVGNIVPDPAERDWQLKHLAPLVGAPFETADVVEWTERTTAWLRFLEAKVTRQPLVLVIEDIHWADPELIAFIQQLRRNIDAGPLMILCSARPEIYERYPDWLSSGDIMLLGLSPLSRDETSALVHQLLPEGQLSAQTDEILVASAGGNPLYAEEFARMVVDHNRLDPPADADPVAIPIPETIQGLIEARVDALPPAGKRLVHDASVFGNVFWPGPLEAMQPDADGIEAALADLVRRQIVRRLDTSSSEGENEYSFSHILVREVAYGQITRGARALKHRAAASWMDRASGESGGHFAEIVAYHYEQALALSQDSAGFDRAEMEGSLHRFALIAGNRLLELDPARALPYFRRALETGADTVEGRAAVRVKVGDALYQTGQYPEAEDEWERVVLLLAPGQDPVAIGEARAKLALALWYQGRTAEAKAVNTLAISELSKQQPGRALITAYADAAFHAVLAGEFDEAASWAERAIELAPRAGADDQAARALQFGAASKLYLGDSAGSEAGMRESLRRCLELGLGRTTAFAYINLANTLWLTRGPEAALQTYQDGIEFSGRRGLAGASSWARAEALWVTFEVGRWDELLATADELIIGLEAEVASHLAVTAATYRALVETRRGGQETYPRDPPYLVAAREIADMQVLVPALLTAAQAAAQAHQDEDASRLLAEFQGLTADNPAWRLHDLASAARVAIAAGVEDISGLLPAEAFAVRRYQLMMLSSRALMAEAAGDMEPAADLFRRASDGWREYGHLPEEGESRLGLARCLAKLARPAEAIEPVRSAVAIASELAATPLLLQGQALQRSLGGSP